MNIKLSNLIKNLTSRPVLTLFFLILTASLFWHLNFRNQHFQECDSSGVYFLLQDFPKSGLMYATLAYPQGHILSTQNAQRILNIPFIHKLSSSYFAKYSKEEMVSRLSTVNPFALWRYAEITTVSLVHLPYFLQSTFALPLSSTYSAGTGLIYGLTTNKNISYETFMSNILFINILFFHICVTLLVLILKKLKVSDMSSTLAGLLMLFSISMYSQGYSAGSVLWIFGSELGWIYLVLKYAEKEDFLKKVSIISAILIFFNYLIALLWAGLMLVTFYKQFQKSKKILPEIKYLFKSQSIALIFISICAILFYQAGQGNRGNTSINTFFSDLYYIVLNFFSFYTHSQFWNTFQFIFGLGLILVFIFILFKKDFWNQSQALKQFWNLTIGFFAIFFAFTLVGILGFAPVRQLLMLAPFIFIASGITINYLFTLLPIKVQNTFGILIIICLITAGAFSLKIRKIDALDRTANIKLDQDLSLAGVYDCSFNLTERNWHSNIPVDFINPRQFEVGKNYLYLSQTLPFETALKDWQNKYNINLSTLNSNTIITETYFLAHNPNYKAYLFTRPNNLYEVKFKVNSISAK